MKDNLIDESLLAMPDAKELENKVREGGEQGKNTNLFFLYNRFIESSRRASIK